MPGSDVTRPNSWQGLLDQWEPRLRASFLEAIYNLRDAAHVDQIVRMLENGDINGALRAVGIDEAAFRPFDKSIANAFEVGGEATAAVIPVAVDSGGFRTVFQFSVRNLEAESWLRQYSGGLIKAITDDQRVAVRDFLTAGLADGANPRTTALDLVGRVSRETGRREGGIIGLTASQEQWVRNYADELASDSPLQALDRELRDKRFDRTVAQAAKDERTLTADEIEPMVRSYKARALRYRAEAISRSETIRALHTAQDMALDQAIASGAVKADQVFMVWRSAHDSRVRDAHRALNGNKIKKGGVFQSSLGPIRFPGDPMATAANTVNCRCTLIPAVDYLSGIR